MRRLNRSQLLWSGLAASLLWLGSGISEPGNCIGDSLLKFSRIELGKDGGPSSTSFNFNTVRRTDLVFTLNLLAPGCSWAKTGSESAVLTVKIDNQPEQNIVVWNGGEQNFHSFYSLPVAAGKHQVTFTFDKSKSPAGAKSISILTGSMHAIELETVDKKLIFQRCPILIGRDNLDNNRNDLPLAMYYRISKKNDGGTAVFYGYIFSNEDGGDAGNPAKQMGRWGRLTDIQHVFTNKFDKDGKLVEEIFEGPDHSVLRFQGEHQDLHPIIQTCTLNNNVTDKPAAKVGLRFQLLPDVELNDSAPPVALRFRGPLYRAMVEEADREKKIDWRGNGSSPSADGEGLQCADPRRYLYVQYRSRNAANGPIAIRVRLKGGKELYSDRALDENWAPSSNSHIAQNHSGWNEAAILMPTVGDFANIAKVDFVSRDPGKGTVEEYKHMFKLDLHYNPVELKCNHVP